jgi:predicted ATPase
MCTRIGEYGLAWRRHRAKFNSIDPLLALVEALKDRRVLLVLDNCEHVLDAVATLAERLFTGAPEVHLLATSREALRVEGEFVYILQALDIPPDHQAMTVEDVMSYSAAMVRLVSYVEKRSRTATNR